MRVTDTVRWVRFDFLTEKYRTQIFLRPDDVTATKSRYIGERLSFRSIEIEEEEALTSSACYVTEPAGNGTLMYSRCSASDATETIACYFRSRRKGNRLAL